MKRNNCILFFLLILSALCFSQTPGYMGKKTVIGYALYLSPVTSDVGVGNTLFNFRNEIFIEKALEKRWMAGIGLGYFRTGYNNELPVKGFGKPTDYYTINGFSTVFYSKHFYKGRVAPWGGYFNWGVVLNTCVSANHEFMYVTSKVQDRDTLYFDFGADKQVTVIPDIMMGFGKTRIFKDKFTVEYGFNAQLVALIKGLAPTDNSSILRNNYILETTILRVQSFNRLSVFLKFGYLF